MVILHEIFDHWSGVVLTVTVTVLYISFALTFDLVSNRLLFVLMK